jgi:DNA-binding IclR family transcriptional regulator
VTAHYAVLDGDVVVYLAKHDPPTAVFGLASALGARLPAVHTAVGKAQLAYLWPPQRVAGHGEGLVAEIDRVRAAGFAVDEGATAAGIRCVAAPVFDSLRCLGAIGISQVSSSAPPLDAVAAAVRAAAGRASARLGGRDFGTGV